VAAETNRRARWAAALLLASGAALIAGCGSSSSASSSASESTSTAASASAQPQAQAGQPGPEQVPLETGAPLASASSTLQGTAIDGVKCAPVEQLAYHIHAHLQVFVNGNPRALPGAIGLVGPVAQQTPAGPFYGAQGCYYWLHTHTNDGIIHIESPTHRIYTLGDFFDEWHQPLSPNQVASATGPVVAYVNGKKFSGDPRNVKLDPHAVIQLNVGSPAVQPQSFSWAGLGL
jgi:hypothetical protein